MPRVPIIKANKLIKVLKKNGFILDHVTGSHYIFFNPTTNKRVSVPVHKGKDLGRGITLAILKDANIDIKEFLKLL